MCKTEGEERFPQSEKPPHGGEISWDRKGPSGDQRRMQLMVCGKQDKVRTVHGLCHHPADPRLSRVSPVAEGSWVLESGVWSMDPGRGHLLAVKRQPEGTGVRSSTTGKVCRKSPGHHRSKASFLSGAQGVGPPL